MAESEEDRHIKLAGEFDCLPEPLPTLRHSTSHVMAQAVKQLFPEVRVAIGPAIEDGFYYDFLKATPFTPEDLERYVDFAREVYRDNPNWVPGDKHHLIKILSGAAGFGRGRLHLVQGVHDLRGPGALRPRDARGHGHRARDRRTRHGACREL